MIDAGRNRCACRYKESEIQTARSATASHIALEGWGPVGAAMVAADAGVGTVIVRVDVAPEGVGVTDVGLKTHLADTGSPETQANVTLEVKLPEEVNVRLYEAVPLDGFNVSGAGGGVTEKSDCELAVTVTMTVALCERVPLVPVTV